MKTVKKALSELKKPERNVRLHSDKQIAEFKRSIEMFGQLRPIVIDETNTILAGNGLHAAMTALGKTEADCYVVSGLSETEKKKLMLADNRIFNLGVDDIKAFEEIVLELGDDFDVPGYDSDVLKTLVYDFSDADEMISGYGVISDDAKENMKKAAERYEREEAAFTQGANAHAVAPEAASANARAKESVQSAEDGSDKVMLSREYLVCPKCGETIWL